jgi:hypothetical protein
MFKAMASIYGTARTATVPWVTRGLMRSYRCKAISGRTAISIRGSCASFVTGLIGRRAP